MDNQDNPKTLQEQLDDYANAYDRISAFMATNSDERKQRMAVAHRKYVLNMMLTLRMEIKYPQTA